MDNNLKILILGGTGTISSAVLRECLDRGFNVTILNRGTYNDKLPQIVSVLIADFRNAILLKQIIVGCKFDVVVDFLSRTREDIARVFPIISPSCKQYIFISSCCVYKRENKDFPIVENSPKPNVHWSYNVHKYEAEEELKELAMKSKCIYTIARPYITYDERRVPYGLAPSYNYHRTIIERIKNGKPLLLWNRGDNLITVTQNRDFARVLIGLFNNARAFSEDFNIVSPFRYTYKEIVESLYKKLNVTSCCIDVCVEDINKNIPTERQMMLGDRTLDAIFDNSKLYRTIDGIKFEYDLEKGLDIILDYYSSSDCYLYDYKYDALIDRIAKIAGANNVGYKRYDGSNYKGLFIYYIYRYLPYKLADFLSRRLNLH